MRKRYSNKHHSCCGDRRPRPGIVVIRIFLEVMLKQPHSLLCMQYHTDVLHTTLALGPHKSLSPKPLTPTTSTYHRHIYLSSVGETHTESALHASLSTSRTHVRPKSWPRRTRHSDMAGEHHPRHSHFQNGEASASRAYFEHNPNRYLYRVLRRGH